MSLESHLIPSGDLRNNVDMTKSPSASVFTTQTCENETIYDSDTALVKPPASDERGLCRDADTMNGMLLSAIFFPGSLISRSDIGSRHEERKNLLESIAREMLHCLGEDPTREGLVDTPERFAKAMLDLTEGYSQDPTDLVNRAIFKENSQLVIVKDIEICSLCEHHLLPFIGKV